MQTPLTKHKTKRIPYKLVDLPSMAYWVTRKYDNKFPTNTFFYSVNKIFCFQLQVCCEEEMLHECQDWMTLQDCQLFFGQHTPNHIWAKKVNLSHYKKPRYHHRPLYSFMDRHERLGACHRGPTFLGLFVTKPVVTPSTNRCSMKDMNKIFPEIV